MYLKCYHGNSMEAYQQTKELRRKDTNLSERRTKLATLLRKENDKLEVLLVYIIQTSLLVQFMQIFTEIEKMGVTSETLLVQNSLKINLS